MPDKPMDYAFLVVGVLVIAFAVIWGRNADRSPVDLQLAKLGIVFKMDVMPFLVIIGLVFASVSVFFRYQDYNGKLEKANKDLEDKNYLLRQYQQFEMRVELLFPDSFGSELPKVQFGVAASAKDKYKYTDAGSSDVSLEANNVLSENILVKDGSRFQFKAKWKGQTYLSPISVVPVMRLTMKADK
jgi:hypothetical protein